VARLLQIADRPGHRRQSADSLLVGTRRRLPGRVRPRQRKSPPAPAPRASRDARVAAAGTKPSFHLELQKTEGQPSQIFHVLPRISPPGGDRPGSHISTCGQKVRKRWLGGDPGRFGSQSWCVARERVCVTGIGAEGEAPGVIRNALGGGPSRSIAPRTGVTIDRFTAVRTASCRLSLAERHRARHNRARANPPGRGDRGRGREGPRWMALRSASED
jgi:hypothetical protein